LAIKMEESADDTSLLYLDLIKHGYEGVDDGDYLIRQIHCGKYTPQEQRNRAKAAWAAHGMQKVRVESNSYQAAMTIDLANEGVPVTAYNTGTEKFDPEMGINSLAVMMELGKVVIPSDPSDPRTVMLSSKLVNQMRAWPSGHTGDILMSFWFAFSEIRSLMGERIMFPRQAMDKIKDSPPVQTVIQRVELEHRADMEIIQQQIRERGGFDKMLSVFGAKAVPPK